MLAVVLIVGVTEGETVIDGLGVVEGIVEQSVTV